MTGHICKGSDIDIHVFTNSAGLVTDILENEGYQFDVERKAITKFQESRVFTHIHVFDRFNFELTVYDEDKAHYVFKSSITGKAIERASIAELEELLAREYPNVDLEADLKRQEIEADAWAVFRMLLLPLENVQQSAKHHPEGDVQYHLFFELAKDARPGMKDAATPLHDVGVHRPRGPRRRALRTGRFDHGTNAVSDRASHGRARIQSRPLGALDAAPGSIGALRRFDAVRELDTAGSVRAPSLARSMSARIS